MQHYYHNIYRPHVKCS